MLWNATQARHQPFPFGYYCCFRVKTAANFIVYTIYGNANSGSLFLWPICTMMIKHCVTRIQAKMGQMKLFNGTELSISNGHKATGSVVNVRFWAHVTVTERLGQLIKVGGRITTSTSICVRMNLWLLRWSSCFCAFSRRWLWQTTRLLGKRKNYFQHDELKANRLASSTALALWRHMFLHCAAICKIQRLLLSYF